MLRSGAAASWTREYQEIEDFTASPSGSPLAHTTTTTSPPPPPHPAFPLSSSPSSAARNRDAAFLPSAHHHQARDQELPLLPNREPSPGPATPPATTSAFHQERLAGRIEESEEHAHAHVPLDSNSNSNASRLSPPSTYSSHSSSGHPSSQSAGYHSQHQHQHQAYPPLSHSSQYHHQQVTTSAMSYHDSQQQPQPRPSTSSIGKTSPLNPGSGSAPTTPGLPPHNTPFARPGSRGSLNLMASTGAAQGQGQAGQTGLGYTPQGQGQGTSGFSRMANEELRALSGPYPNGLTSGLPPTPGSRGSMILYRRADSFTTNGAGLAQGPMAPEEGNRYTLHLGQGDGGAFLPPPPIGGGGHGGSNRGSMYSVSGDSIASMGMGDSKYPPSLFAPGTPGTPIRTTGSGLRGPFQGLEGRGTSAFDGRGSLFSDGRTSVAFSLNGMGGGGLVAYAYDPDEEDLSEDDEDDWLHDPEVAYPKSRKGLFSSSSSSGPPPLPAKGATGIQHSNSVSGSSAGGHSDAVLKGKASTVGVGGGVESARTSAEGHTGEKDKRGLRVPHPSKVPPHYRGTASWSWRGVVNITTLIAMLASLLALFMVYPMIRDKMDSGVNARITGNTRINATGQAVEGDSDGGSSSRSTSRTTTRELNPGGVTFNRRGVLFDLPPATATAPSAASFTEGKAPSDWAQVVPFHGKYGSGKDGKEPALRWMRNGTPDESVKPWPAPPLVRPPRPSPVGGAEVPEATSYYTLEEEDDIVDEGGNEGEDWVVFERPPKYKHAEERPKSRAPTATPTRSESGAAEATLWSVAESGEEVLMECGEACKKGTNERW